MELGKNDSENVIAPFNTEFQSNIFKMSAFGSAQISVRFNAMEDFKNIDAKIRKIATPSRKLRKTFQTQFDGGLTRQPLPATDLNNSLFGKLNTLAKEIYSRIVPEHRWSSSDICNIPGQIPKIDGLGPVGGFDKQKSEFILRNSLVDRALLLALLLNKA